MNIQNTKDIIGILDFLKHAEQLKETTRKCWTSKGKQESVAEHTWRLCLMVMLFEKNLPENTDVKKLMKMCLIHDIAEIIDGDVPATVYDPNKSARERKNLIILMKPLPQYIQKEMLALWDEYEAAETNESILAKSMDKLETIMQHNIGINPKDFDYEFSLGYGKEYTNQIPFFKEVREFVEEDTRAKISSQKRLKIA